MRCMPLFHDAGKHACHQFCGTFGMHVFGFQHQRRRRRCRR